MSSFFTLPSSSRKRKRGEPSTAPRKATKGRKPGPKLITPPSRDDSISGSDIESNEGSVQDIDVDTFTSEDEGSVEDTTAARRLKLAETYLSNIRSEVADETVGFDAADLDRDLIAERLKEDAAESKGKLYRNIDDVDFGGASHCLFGWDGQTFTSVAICEPYVYTVSKDLGLAKWRLQDLPKDQLVQWDKRKKRTKPLPPAKKKPVRMALVRGDRRKCKDPNYKGHTDVILTVAASQDGKFVVTGGRDRKIIVWDTRSLQQLKVFTQHRDAVTALAFRRGTNQLYSSSKDRTLKVWSLDELAYVETLFGHQDEVVDVAALAQERCISVGARDRTARLWKVVEETQLVFRGGGSSKQQYREGSIDRVAMIDDDLFVTGSDNGSLSLWTIHKKKAIFEIPLCHGIESPLSIEEASAECHPDASVVPPGQPRWITALTAIPYSNIIMTGSWDGFIRLWRISPDKKRLESVGELGTQEAAPNGSDIRPTSTFRVNGYVNDIAVFERGERGKDGVCVVAVTGKEHRLGNWKKRRGKNGAIVFEASKVREHEP